MIHSHNNNEHERILDSAQNLGGVIDSLYANYHNGDKKLNNLIQLLQKHHTQLLDRLDHHVASTQSLDDVYENYHRIVMVGKWVLGIGGSVLTGFLLRHLTI